MMNVIRGFILLLLIAVSPVSAGQMTLLGAGLPGAVAPPTYTGPGDVVGSALGFWSCARAYNAAYANGTNQLCDLVASTGGAAVCTLRVATTGFVDLANTYCPGSLTPSAACAAASGGSCKVKKVYDQTGNTKDIAQATLANMPALTFSCGGTSLPCMQFTLASSQVLSSSGTILMGQPWTISSVAERTAAFTTAQAWFSGSPSGAQIVAAFTSSANTANLYAGINSANVAASDSVLHAFQDIGNDPLGNGTSIIVVDSTATTGLVTSANSATNAASTVNIGSGNGGTFLTGFIFETGFWQSAFNATQYGNMNTNQHSATNGYNF